MNNMLLQRLSYLTIRFLGPVLPAFVLLVCVDSIHAQDSGVAPQAEDIVVTMGGEENAVTVKSRDDWKNRVEFVVESGIDPIPPKRYKVKFHIPVEAKHLGFRESMKWARDFVVNPNAAADREVMRIYGMSDMKPKDWQAVLRELNKSEDEKGIPPRIAIVVRVGDEYETNLIAMPVKWNKQMATALNSASSVDSSDSTLNPLQIVAGAVHVSAFQETEESPYNFSEGRYPVEALEDTYFATNVRMEGISQDGLRVVTSQSAWPDHGLTACINC